MTAPIYATPKVLLLLQDEDGVVIKLTNHESSLLLYAEIGSAITMATNTQNLMQFFVQSYPAIMIPSLLLYAQIGSATMTALNARKLLLPCIEPTQQLGRQITSIPSFS
jgi:hypothetical protein